MNNTTNLPVYLDRMQREIYKIIEESNRSPEKSPNYQALKDIIDILLSGEESNHRFDEFNDTLIAMAHLDFSKRMDTEQQDVFSYIATGFNLLNEELEELAAPKHFLETAIEFIQDAVLLFDIKGTVLFANQKIEAVAGYSKAEIINKSVTSLFVSKRINEKIQEGYRTSDFIINVVGKNNQLVPVQLKVNKMQSFPNAPEGWLVVIKKKGE